MKKYLFALGGIASTALAFAEDSTTLGVTASDFSGLSTALQGWVTQMVPVLVGIAAAFIGFYLLKFGIRLIKSMLSTSK